MKILQLCLRFPFPPVDGGTMAMVSTAKGLTAVGAELTIAALNTTKHWANTAKVNEVSKQYNIHALPIDNRITPLNTILNLLGNEAFHVSRFFDRNVEFKIIELLKANNYDAVVFESLFMSPYLNVVKQYSKAVTVLRSHNIEYRIWERVCHQTQNILKRKYLSVQVQRLKKYELELTAQYDLIAAISQVDLDFYKNQGLSKKSFYLPFGLDCNTLKRPPKGKIFKIGHLGSMDWIPNQEGIRWFLRDVWPLVESKNVKCFFAGRHMPKDIEALAGENIKILGEVKSAKDFLNQLDLLIVPLQSGSGVRIKVLESMAYGLPILATKMGYEGIHAQNGVSILEANTAQNFAAKIDQVANNQVDLNALAQQAQVVLTKQHSPIKAAELLVTKISKSKSE